MRRPRAPRPARSALGVVLTSTLTTALLTGTLAVSTNGCGDDPSEGGAPPPQATGALPSRDAGAEAKAPVDASPVDAGPQSRRFVGTLAATKPMTFGGSPYCTYKMTMKNVDVDVTVTGNGDIANASVSNVAFEETVPPCSQPPLEPNLQKYYLASSSKLPNGGAHLELARDPLNRTAATLILEGDFRVDDVKALLEWHRTDIGSPFDWRITTTVSLASR